MIQSQRDVLHNPSASILLFQPKPDRCATGLILWVLPWAKVSSCVCVLGGGGACLQAVELVLASLFSLHSEPLLQNRTKQCCIHQYSVGRACKQIKSSETYKISVSADACGVS